MAYTPEDARRVLAENHGDIPDYDFFVALRDGELPRYSSAAFAFKRLYSDDLPGPVLVAMWHPDYPFMKCRTNVIKGIISDVHRSAEYGIVTDSGVLAEMQLFLQRQWNALRGGFKGEYLTTREEINVINDTLDMVIHSIEFTHGIQTDWKSAQKKLDDERKRYRKMYGE